MKKLKFPALLLLCVAFLLCSSCSKDDDPKLTIDPNSLAGQLEGTYSTDAKFYDLESEWTTRALVSYKARTDSTISINIELTAENIYFFLEIIEPIVVREESGYHFKYVANGVKGNVNYNSDYLENCNISITGFLRNDIGGDSGSEELLYGLAFTAVPEKTLRFLKGMIVP